MMKSFDEKRILYTDDACLVVNKIPGEAAEGAGQGMSDLPALLAASYGGPGDMGKETAGSEGNKGAFLSAAHRLDVPASGCVLFARNPQAAAYYGEAFRKGAVSKLYWAITELPSQGTALPEKGELIHWLRSDPRNNKSYASKQETPGGKRAVLRYRVAGRGERYLFLEIELLSGRHHQIRAQLCAEGIHIKGDLKYGARRSEKGGGIRLHARSLRFPVFPGGKDYAAVSADPPLRDALWSAFEEAALGL